MESPGHDGPLGSVLIVEDDVDIAESLAELVRHDGFTTRLASNGEDGLRRLHEGAPPCCILLDLMMPVMSGWDFLETLQDDRPEYRGIPVIVVSAAHQPQLPEGVRLLAKPLDLELLTDAIRSAVGAH